MNSLSSDSTVEELWHYIDALQSTLIRTQQELIEARQLLIAANDKVIAVMKGIGYKP